MNSGNHRISLTYNKNNPSFSCEIEQITFLYRDAFFERSIRMYKTDLIGKGSVQMRCSLSFTSNTLDGKDDQEEMNG